MVTKTAYESILGAAWNVYHPLAAIGAEKSLSDTSPPDASEDSIVGVSFRQRDCAPKIFHESIDAADGDGAPQPEQPINTHGRETCAPTEPRGVLPREMCATCLLTFPRPRARYFMVLSRPACAHGCGLVLRRCANPACRPGLPRELRPQVRASPPPLHDSFIRYFPPAFRRTLTPFPPPARPRPACRGGEAGCRANPAGPTPPSTPPRLPTW